MLEGNIIKIAVYTGVILLGALAFFLTTKSLKSLKKDATPYYPFDLFLPKSGTWSVGYFLVLIIFLSLFVFFLMKGGFYRGPA